MSKWTFTGIDNYVKLANTTLFRISMEPGHIWFIGALSSCRWHFCLQSSLPAASGSKSFFRAMICLPNIVSAVALATMWARYVYSPKFGL